MAEILCDNEMIGMALSTALRKLCDSSPTTIAYHCVHNIDNKIWEAYLDHVWAVLCDVDNPSWETVKEASLDFDDNFQVRDNEEAWKIIKEVKGQESWYYTFISSFRCFSDNDWESYSYWVFNE